MKAIRFFVLLLATASPAAAQQISLDKPVRAGDLVMFRDVQDEKAYYYAPTRPRLAIDDNGVPQFSFFRWVDNVRSGARETEAREGEGGGIVHALVTFGVPRELLADAARDLQRQIPGARVAGPIVPKAATFALVSSLASKDGKESANKFATQVLGIGNAPILDGDKAAVSITLTKLGAQVLWEQFQTPTPDISFHFEITVNGFLAPIRATVEANLDEIVKHDSFAAGIAGNFFGAQIKGAFDELRRQNVIKLTQVGSDANFEVLIKKAYDQLVDVLFEKTSPANATAAPQADSAGSSGEDFLKRATDKFKENKDAADKIRKENEDITKKNTDRRVKREAAAAAEKQAKDLQERLRRDLNKSSADTRTFPFDENIGDLRPLFKTGAFRQVNIDDPLYQQREIVAILDGLNSTDFGEYVNFVSLRLRKTHESGQITDDEVRIDRRNFNQEGAAFKLLYGWKGDNKRRTWMDYEYQTVWSFFGGASLQTPWTKASANEIALTPPMQRRSIELKADPKRLADQGVRAVSVKVFYRASPDGPEQVKQLTLNAGTPTFVGRLDFIAPTGTTEYEYEIAWRLSGNREVSSGRQKTSFTSLDVDELPKGTHEEAIWVR